MPRRSLSSLASISSPTFLEFIERLPTLRCADCHIMQLPWRPFIEPFWNRPLCDACRMDDKYRLVMAYTAKKNYFLDENDLLGLRTFSQRNPHHKNASHVRFFSRVDVQRRSELKLRRLRTTRIERLRKRDLRSQKAKDRWRQRVANHREQIIQLLTANGFPYASRHYCTAVDGFVRNLSNGRRVRGLRQEMDCRRRYMNMLHEAPDIDSLVLRTEVTYAVLRSQKAKESGPLASTSRKPS